LFTSSVEVISGTTSLPSLLVLFPQESIMKKNRDTAQVPKNLSLLISSSLLF
jgi:hypothetical protein